MTSPDSVVGNKLDTKFRGVYEYTNINLTGDNLVSLTSLNISNASLGNNPAIYADGGQITINGVNVHDNKAGGIYIQNAGVSFGAPTNPATNLFTGWS